MFFRELRKGLHTVQPYPWQVIRLGAWLGSLYCLGAIVSLTYAPYSENILHWFTLARQLLQTAPANLAAAVCAAVVCDLMIRQKKGDS